MMPLELHRTSREAKYMSGAHQEVAGRIILRKLHQLFVH